jgi:hypothetical protein
MTQSVVLTRWRDVACGGRHKSLARAQRQVGRDAVLKSLMASKSLFGHHLLGKSFERLICAPSPGPTTGRSRLRRCAEPDGSSAQPNGDREPADKISQAYEAREDRRFPAPSVRRNLE